METTKRSSTGQIILPKVIRDVHAWEPNTELPVDDTPDGVLLRPRKDVPPTPWAMSSEASGMKDRRLDFD